MTGPGDGTWGVDQITVGFIQHEVDERHSAGYFNGNGAPRILESTIATGRPGAPHYPLLDVDRGARTPWYLGDNASYLDGRSGTLDGHDSPSEETPVYYSQGASLDQNARDDIINIEMQFQFELDVAAHLSAAGYGNSGIYTRLATAWWSYLVDGAFLRPEGINTGFHGINTVFGDHMWSDVTDGSREDTHGPTTFDALDIERFN